MTTNIDSSQDIYLSQSPSALNQKNSLRKFILIYEHTDSCCQLILMQIGTQTRQVEN